MSAVIICNYCGLGSVGRLMIRHIQLYHSKIWTKFLSDPRSFPLVCYCGWKCLTDARTFTKHVNHHVMGRNITPQNSSQAFSTTTDVVQGRLSDQVDTRSCEVGPDGENSTDPQIHRSNHINDEPICAQQPGGDGQHPESSPITETQTIPRTARDEVVDKQFSDSAVHRYIMELYTKGTITTKTIQMSVSATQSLLQTTIEMHKTELSNLEMKLPDQLKGHIKDELLSMHSSLERSRQLFHGLDTEHLRMKYLKRQGLILPSTYKIGSYNTTRSDGVTVQCDATAEYVSVIDTLTHYIEKEKEYSPQRHGIIKSYLDTDTYLSNDYYSSHPDAHRLLLYHDDIEVANVLGSRAGVHKLTMFYIAVDGYTTGKLADIHLAIVCHASDLGRIGYGPILAPLIADLEMLSVGLRIESADGTSHDLYARLEFLAADNLAANQIIGINRSFSKGHFCRFCYAGSEECSKSVRSNQLLLRSDTSHKLDVEFVEFDPTFSTRTGVRERSALTDISYLSVINSSVPDIMHDFLEGIGPRVVKLVLQHLVAHKLLTLKEFNERLVSFHYGSHEFSNRPSVQLSLENIKQTASQMWCLIRFLPQIIGHRIPEENPAWSVFLRLRAIMDLVFSPTITIGATYTLTRLIEEHHTQYLEVFPGERLTAKAHWITHYPSLIRRFGPLIHFWCMRFEGKHRLAKGVTAVSCNFMNVPKTVAKRYQVKEHADRDVGSYVIAPKIKQGDSIVVGVCPTMLEPVFGRVDKITGERQYECRAYQTAWNPHLHSYDVEYLSDEVITINSRDILYRLPMSLIKDALNRPGLVLRHAVI